MNQRRTKIIATIGPASRDAATIRALMLAGMDVARMNFSHGNHETHAETLRLLRQTAAELGREICVLQDLQGPKIRVGEFPEGSVQLQSGQTFTLSTTHKDCSAAGAWVDYAALPGEVTPGGRILLDDGNLALTITAAGPDWIETRVTLGGVLKSRKGVNVPGAQLSLRGLTEKDAADLAFGLQQGIDAVAVSFVRTVEDVQSARRLMGSARIPLIAKLERPEALEHLDGIVAAADGVMVARGDLGVELPPEVVPGAQKRIIETANRQAKLVITATQMLESMILNPRPTRAEASDVANAIFDGSDAVMLSGETAAGQYPALAVETMAAIACEAERELDTWGRWKGDFTPLSHQDDAYFITLAARELAHDRNVSAVVVFTRSGRTGILMSKARPCVPILAFTPEERVARWLGLLWGVQSFRAAEAATLDGVLAEVNRLLLASGSVTTGQQVALICGYPLGVGAPANLTMLHTVK